MQPVAAPPAVIGLGRRPAQISGAAPGAYEAKLAGFALAAAQAARGAPCPGAQVSSVDGQPLSDGDLGRERLARPGGTGAVWREHLQVNGCGASVRVRLYMARMGEEAWGVLPLTPGDGHAGLLLGRDAGPAIAAAAVMQAPRLACDEAEIKRSLRLTDTTPVTPYAPGQPWTERWTWTICGQPRAVLVTFTPDPVGGGTSYSVRAR